MTIVLELFSFDTYLYAPRFIFPPSFEDKTTFSDSDLSTYRSRFLNGKMFSIKKLKASKPKPYSNPLKVKVIGVGDKSTYTTADGECVVLSNYVYRADPHPTIVVTAVTRVMKTSAFAVPEDVKLTAKAIANPAPAKIITIHDAKKSPIKSLEEIIRTVQIRGTDVQVRNVRVKDGTEEVKVALWRDQVDGCKVGEFLEFSNLVTNSYMDDVSLSTTQRTKIQPCDAPPSMLTGTVIAYEKSEFGFSIMVEDGDTFQTVGIPINMVRDALECDEYSVEDTLSIRIPFSVAVGTTNGIVSSFALV
ncbi:uncharacterized protein LOC128173547 [Crassostrea angulata]|uniref:uncharacterized protein LOC128173547 n=1 Tax=Magallana angulata TaxID=2784310 RepID=UPI0022B1B65F|nr:uncharacterized protein LOC128173547 [Crassostrea angulata]